MKRKSGYRRDIHPFFRLNNPLEVGAEQVLFGQPPTADFPLRFSAEQSAAGIDPSNPPWVREGSLTGRQFPTRPPEHVVGMNQREVYLTFTKFFFILIRDQGTKKIPGESDR